MKELAFLFIGLIAGANSASLSDYLPSLVEIKGNFNNNIKNGNGNVELKSGPVNVVLGRDKSGNMVGGIGMARTGELDMGMFGKISIQGTTTVEGMYNAMINTELTTGSRSFNPLTLSVTRKKDGQQYGAMTDLGFVGGSFVASTVDNTIPKFEVHLNTDGWLTAKAAGQVNNGNYVMESYVAGVDVGLMSCSASWDGDMKLKDYEIGGSLGLIHGSVKRTKTDTDYVKSYKAGFSLGVMSMDMLVTPTNEKTYITVFDAGLLKVKHSNKNGKQTGKGSVELSNFGLDYEIDENGLQIGGGWIQYGSSIIEIHKDSNGEYHVDVKRGTHNT